MAKPIKNWKSGDTTALALRIRRRDGSLVDLTGATGLFYMRARGASANKVDGAAIVVTKPTIGEIEYPWTPADVDTAGVYAAEIRFTMIGGKTITTETFIIGMEPAMG